MLCRKLVLENLYSQAALVACDRDSSSCRPALSEASSFERFGTSLAGHVAATAGWQGMAIEDF
ncbi:MAG: hypothetical protein LBI99_00475 [Propionibacteriaceae bacterium]|nr:hypothetical protein [Propionibacteriaceae bacterium]